MFILFPLCKRIIVGKGYFEREVPFRGMMSASESLRKLARAQLSQSISQRCDNNSEELERKETTGIVINGC